jgi:hypothetical protein
MSSSGIDVNEKMVKAIQQQAIKKEHGRDISRGFGR